MKIDILTLFPDMFDGFLNTSIIKRAIDDNLCEVKFLESTIPLHIIVEVFC